MTEKALADDSCQQVKVDFCIITDAVPEQFVDEIVAARPFAAGKIAVCIDHDTPSGSVDVSRIQRKLIGFAKKYGIHLYNGQGIGYINLLERELRCGDVVVGCGTYIGTVGALGAEGMKVEPSELVKAVSTGIISVPQCKTYKLFIRGKKPCDIDSFDIGQSLLAVLDTQVINGCKLLIASEEKSDLSFEARTTICHILSRSNAAVVLFSIVDYGEPDMVFNLAQAARQIIRPDMEETNNAVLINEVFIGGCNGGKIEDLRAAAQILKGRHIAAGLRLIIAPATSRIYGLALSEGLISIFLAAGAVIMNQGCSVCWGRSQGVMADGEVLVSTGSYNHAGCAGAKTAKVYLVSSSTAAELAIDGRIL